MFTDIFLIAAEAVFAYSIDRLDPAKTIKSWLKREPARLAFQKALAHTYAAFARQHPDPAGTSFGKITWTGSTINVLPSCNQACQ